MSRTIAVVVAIALSTSTPGQGVVPLGNLGLGPVQGSAFAATPSDSSSCSGPCTASSVGDDELATAASSLFTSPGCIRARTFCGGYSGDLSYSLVSMTVRFVVPRRATYVLRTTPWISNCGTPGEVWTQAFIRRYAPAGPDVAAALDGDTVSGVLGPGTYELVLHGEAVLAEGSACSPAIGVAQAEAVVLGVPVRWAAAWPSSGGITDEHGLRLCGGPPSMLPHDRRRRLLAAWT